ncbi:MAG: hypothetical protein LBE78_12950 [Burkholderiaceae bacterium]|jgi:hypothetical protein|nr:hypothetical protein [Burkholderiaceae bacterium]
MASDTPLPQGIEIFKPGRHIDMDGQVHEFSVADVRRMAESYNPAAREAPLTVGHPEHDKPAYGYVKALSVSAAGRLAMDTHQVAPQFAEWVKAGHYKKRSAAFYPPAHPNNPTPGAWYLRHVAFLGAQPPAIAGLTDVQFAAGDEQGLVAFADAATDQPVTTKEHTTMTEAEQAELQRQLKAAQDEAAAAKTQLAAASAERDAAQAQAARFAEAAKAERTAVITAFAEAQIKAGTLLPKDKLLAITALEALSDANPVEFAEGDATRKVSLAGWLQELIAGAKPRVQFGEFKPGGAQWPLPGGAKGKSDADIDRAAKQYAAQNKVGYAEALTAVVSFDC